MLKNTSLDNKLGHLVWAYSSGDTRVNPIALHSVLENSKFPSLGGFVPKPPHPQTAFTRAIKKVKLPDSLEFNDLGNDSDGDRVVLLCRVTADVENKDFESRRVGAAMVKLDGTFEFAADSAEYEPPLLRLQEEYEKQIGALTPVELWRVCVAIAATTGVHFRVKDGVLFVSDRHRNGAKATGMEYLEEFDRALGELGSPYRLTKIVFRGENAAAVASSVTLEFLNEFQALVADWKERKEKAAAGNRRIRQDGAETTLNEAESLILRYETMKEAFGVLIDDFETAVDALRKEAAAAAGFTLD